MQDTSALAITRCDWPEPRPADERELVLAAQSDPEAFGAPYERYFERMYRYIRTRTASDEEALDLTQQVFVKALSGLQSYRNRGLPFGAWLFRIARNVVIDARRRRRPSVEWDLVPDLLQPSYEWGTEEVIVKQEALERLRELMLTLRPDQRELIVLRFEAQLPVAQIAKVLGKSYAATHKQLMRTLDLLKEAFRAQQ